MEVGIPDCSAFVSQRCLAWMTAKKQQRMNAKSPDPDDLASEELPKPPVRLPDQDHPKRKERPNPDFSAPHIPPVDD